MITVDKQLSPSHQRLKRAELDQSIQIISSGGGIQ
jgi:hypothetical protein